MVRPRTYRDNQAMAIEAAEHLKRKYPHSAVTVENFRPARRPRSRTNLI
jgi:hypothetical protein